MLHDIHTSSSLCINVHLKLKSLFSPVRSSKCLKASHKPYASIVTQDLASSKVTAILNTLAQTVQITVAKNKPANISLCRRINKCLYSHDRRTDSELIS